MSRDVGMSLLISAILSNIVEIISADDDCSVHFGTDTHTFKDTASDRDVASEGAFLVNVVCLNSVGRGVEAESDFLEVSDCVHFLCQSGNSCIILSS